MYGFLRDGMTLFLEYFWKIFVFQMYFFQIKVFYLIILYFSILIHFYNVFALDLLKISSVLNSRLPGPRWRGRSLIARISVLYFSFSLKRLKSWGRKINNARLNPRPFSDRENFKQNYAWRIFAYLICGRTLYAIKWRLFFCNLYKMLTIVKQKKQTKWRIRREVN